MKDSSLLFWVVKIMSVATLLLLYAHDPQIVFSHFLWLGMRYFPVSGICDETVTLCSRVKSTYHQVTMHFQSSVMIPVADFTSWRRHCMWDQDHLSVFFKTFYLLIFYKNIDRRWGCHSGNCMYCQEFF